MFVLRDCLEANGIALSSNRGTYSRIQNEKGIARFATPGGTQSLVTISEKGFNTLSMRGHKPCSDAFRDWLADVEQVLALPCPAAPRTRGRRATEFRQGF
jgi:prophage antirepressor-like protein